MIKIAVRNNMYNEHGIVIQNSTEIHEVLGLQNIDHMIATINSIVENNMKHIKPHTVIDKITVSMSFINRKILKDIVNHFKNSSLNVCAGEYII